MEPNTAFEMQEQKKQLGATSCKLQEKNHASLFSEQWMHGSTVH